MALHSGAQSLQSEHLGQLLPTVNGAALSQARRDKEAGSGDWWKVKHGGFGVRGRHDIFSRKGCTTGAVMFSVSGVVEEVDKDVVSHTDVWAGVDGLAPDLADLYREG